MLFGCLSQFVGQVDWCYDPCTVLSGSLTTFPPLGRGHLASQSSWSQALYSQRLVLSHRLLTYLKEVYSKPYHHNNIPFVLLSPLLFSLFKLSNAPYFPVSLSDHDTIYLYEDSWLSTRKYYLGQMNKAKNLLHFADFIFIPFRMSLIYNKLNRPKYTGILTKKITSPGKLHQLSCSSRYL